MSLTAISLVPVVITVVIAFSSQGHSKRNQPASGHHDLIYYIEEECDIGTMIADLAADTGLRAKYPAEIVRQLRFQFLTPAPGFIRVNNTSGQLHVTGRIDRDAICRQESETCRIQEDVAVQPVQYFNIIKVTIEIRDINDHRPTFIPDQIVHEMSESAVPGTTSVVLPLAIDLDSRKFAVQRYQLESNSPLDDPGLFQLKVSEKLDGSTEIRLVLALSLDREQRNIHRVVVVAVDGGQLSGSIDVSIVVVDANDNAPTFDGGGHYEVRLAENSPPSTSVLRVGARDDDAGDNGRVLYSLAASTRATYGHLFTINNITGEIYVTGNVDYETTQVCHLIVVATDCAAPPETLSSEATVVVTVEDVNDKAPVIVVNTLYDADTDVAHVTENAKLGTFVGHVIVTDPDRGAGGQFNCTLGSADDDEHFLLRHISGGEYHVITSTVTEPPDRERQKRYRTSVICRDLGVPPLTSVKRLTVDVLDINDNPPKFAQNTFNVVISEDADIGEAVLRANASDVDENSVIVYRISNNTPSSSAAVAHFTVDPNTGVVTVAAKLDRETIGKYQFQLYAIDGLVYDGGNVIDGASSSLAAMSLTATAKVVIRITDVNDERPMFTNDGLYNFRVSERRSAGTNVGSVSASDTDLPPYNEFRFELSTAEERFETRHHHHHHHCRWVTSAFNIDSKTGELTTARELDREQCDVYRLLVLAFDVADTSLVSTATVSIVIDDVNDNAPVFLFPSVKNRTAEVVGPVRQGQRVAVVRAIDADIGINGRISYAVGSSSLTGFSTAYDLSGHNTYDPSSVNAHGSEVRKKNGLPFYVEPLTGYVIASTDIAIPTDANNVTFTLPLLAIDGGNSQQRTTEQLHVIVVRWSETASRNSSYRFQMFHAAGLTLADENLVILVTVCSLTLVVAIGLLIAIAFVACQHRIVAAVDCVSWRRDRSSRNNGNCGGRRQITGNIKGTTADHHRRDTDVGGSKTVGSKMTFAPVHTSGNGITSRTSGGAGSGGKIASTMALSSTDEQQVVQEGFRNGSVVIRLINEKRSNKLAPRVC